MEEYQNMFIALNRNDINTIFRTKYVWKNMNNELVKAPGDTSNSFISDKVWHTGPVDVK